MKPVAVDGFVPPVSPELATLLAALHARCFAGVAGAGWSARAIRTMLDAPATQCWLSRTQDGPRGLILVRAAGGDCEILTFGVDPACRRRGHGRMLMHAAAGWAVETGLERAVLEVAETNTAALELYRRLGFVRSGLRKRYYRTPGGSVDALVLASPTSVLLNET